MHDPFTYAMGLRDGTVIEFENAILANQEWVHITPTQHSLGVMTDRVYEDPFIKFNFERGMDIRISEIAWVADAPFGS